MVRQNCDECQLCDYSPNRQPSALPLQVVGAVGFMEQRLKIPENLDPEVAKLITDCWARWAPCQY